jgi:hypothetical protein
MLLPLVNEGFAAREVPIRIADGSMSDSSTPRTCFSTYESGNRASAGNGKFRQDSLVFEVCLLGISFQSDASTIETKDAGLTCRWTRTHGYDP